MWTATYFLFVTYTESWLSECLGQILQLFSDPLPLNLLIFNSENELLTNFIDELPKINLKIK